MFGLVRALVKAGSSGKGVSSSARGGHRKDNVTEFAREFEAWCLVTSKLPHIAVSFFLLHKFFHVVTELSPVVVLREVLPDVVYFTDDVMAQLRLGSDARVDEYSWPDGLWRSHRCCGKVYCVYESLNGWYQVQYGCFGCLESFACSRFSRRVGEDS